MCSWLMLSYYKGPVYCIKLTGYCYHLVNVISLSPSQSDHIKHLPLEMKYLKPLS